MDLQSHSKTELIAMLEDAAKLWLAHDGLWFQSIEKQHGMDEAIRCDTEAWQRFTEIEAQRIMRRHNITPGGGLDALAQALQYRLYAYVNTQEIVDKSETRMVFRMNNCRVQAARKRRQLPDFPCKSVGLVEYSGFARAIDTRIQTRCLFCPPDEHPQDCYCAWEFFLAANTEDQNKRCK